MGRWRERERERAGEWEKGSELWRKSEQRAATSSPLSTQVIRRCVIKVRMTSNCNLNLKRVDGD